MAKEEPEDGLAAEREALVALVAERRGMSPAEAEALVDLVKTTHEGNGRTGLTFTSVPEEGSGGLCIASLLFPEDEGFSHN